MNELLNRLAERASTSPDAVSLESADEKLTAAGLLAEVGVFGEFLETANIKRLGLLAQNGPGWIIADLACQFAGICLLPLPHFFSDTQLRSSMERAGVDALMTDDSARLARLITCREVRFDRGNARGLTLHKVVETAQPAIPDGTCKITFTSGTTGTPRGVCLDNAQQLRVAQALDEAVHIKNPRHLCLLPLSTLLENIGGVYSPLLAGGTVIVPTGEEIGLSGAAGLDIPKMLGALEKYQPTSLILLPQMLAALVAAIRNGWTPPASLIFAAVGGGKVAPDLIHAARAGGLPVFEGYGLSETASVACLNRPGCDAPGSVGKPLGHVDISIDNGEIIVRGNPFLGYVDDPASWYARSVATGDLGYLDPQGFLYINGRKKNVLISSFGRNISPEWVESQVMNHPLLAQCLVFGDARPCCVALVVPANPACRDQEISELIDRVNSELPDYARVRNWHRLSDPLTPESGLLTDNGRPRRALIEQRYAQIIESLYSSQLEVNAS